MYGILVLSPICITMLNSDLNRMLSLVFLIGCEAIRYLPGIDQLADFIQGGPIWRVEPPAVECAI